MVHRQDSLYGVSLASYWSVLGLKDNMTSLFAKDKKNLAEARENMVDLYLVNLLRQPERVKAIPLFHFLSGLSASWFTG